MIFYSRPAGAIAFGSPEVIFSGSITKVPYYGYDVYSLGVTLLSCFFQNPRINPLEEHTYGIFEAASDACHYRYVGAPEQLESLQPLASLFPELNELSIVMLGDYKNRPTAFQVAVTMDNILQSQKLQDNDPKISKNYQY